MTYGEIYDRLHEARNGAFGRGAIILFDGTEEHRLQPGGPNAHRIAAVFGWPKNVVKEWVDEDEDYSGYMIGPTGYVAECFVDNDTVGGDPYCVWAIFVRVDKFACHVLTNMPDQAWLFDSYSMGEAICDLNTSAPLGFAVPYNLTE